MRRETKDYSKVFTEMDEIFKHLPEEMLDRIPVKVIKEIKANKDTEYEFKYDRRKQLMNQDIYVQTKDFLSIIYIMFICSKTEKERLLNMCKEKNLELEKKKKLQYQSNELFKADKNKKEKEEEETALSTETVNWFAKFINKIKSFFKKV